jgi:hypothetical protein
MRSNLKTLDGNFPIQDIDNNQAVSRFHRPVDHDFVPLKNADATHGIAADTEDERGGAAFHEVVIEV